MAVTLHEITPVGLCVATQELFDVKRFTLNFCDGLILRGKDQQLKTKLTLMKRELNAFKTQSKFLDGYKVVIINNIDKIIGLVSSRFMKISLKTTKQVISDGKEMIRKILNVQSFDDIRALEPEFKRKITLPIYEMFIASLRQSKVEIM